MCIYIYIEREIISFRGICIYVYMCMYIYIYIYTYIYIYMYVCVYIYIYIYIYIQLRVSNLRAIAYAHVSMPFELRVKSPPGAGPTF